MTEGIKKMKFFFFVSPKRPFGEKNKNKVESFHGVSI